MEETSTVTKESLSSTAQVAQERLLTIVGPTAVGKTDLTLRLAAHLHSPVISGDAYQIYRGLDIGTAKPSPAELEAVPHYLIDILEPEAYYSAADFQAQAAALITECNREGLCPILSGGTGFYVQSLLEQYEFSAAEPDAALRRELDALVATKGIEGLVAYAQELALQGGITLPFTDKHRLYRAIERMRQNDYTSLQQPAKQGLRYQGPVIGLRRERSALYERINQRVDIMVDQGLFREVKELLQTGVSPQCQAFKGIGYKEVVAYYDGLCTKQEAIDAIKQNTRRFAKRQLTWYKRMPYITWLTLTPHTTGEEVFEQALTLLAEHGL